MAGVLAQIAAKILFEKIIFFLEQKRTTIGSSFYGLRKK
jgi:hypothetical protein